MLVFRESMVERDERIRELTERMEADQATVERLKAELEAVQANTAVRQLDPKRVRASKFANRLEASYLTEDFARLRAEMAVAGGNVQPVKVRPITGDPDHDFELVYGHRRHRSALLGGMLINAIVEEMDDAELFKHMELENRGRAELRPYELGLHYARALDEALFRTQSEMAAALGVSQAMVSKLVSLGRLPSVVVECFASPLDLSVRMGMELTAALEQDARGVIKRAERVCAGPRPAAADVVRLLCGGAASKETVLRGPGERQATLKTTKRGIQVNVRGATVDADLVAEIEAVVRKWTAAGQA